MICPSCGHEFKTKRAPKAGSGRKRSIKGPTFVCQFIDGVETRMTTHCTDAAPDWDRGLRLAAHAWTNRQRTPIGMRLAEAQQAIKAYDRSPLHDPREYTRLQVRMRQELRIWLDYQPVAPKWRACWFERDGARITEVRAQGLDNR